MNSLLSLVLHGLLGWLLCAAVMGVGTLFSSLPTTLWIHAVSVPLIFGLITFAYYSKKRYVDPWAVAVVFLVVVLVLDLGVVAYLILGSFAMFQSLLGLWVPLGLIFFSTYLVGLYSTRRLPKRLDIFS